MNERAQRIVATAINLAEQGGFEAVRLRDVASHAEVAMGTLYRYFSSKEDLLIAALTLEVEQLSTRMNEHPAPGDTPLARLSAFFGGATRGLCRRPNFARAILRAASSGDHDLAEKVAAFHVEMTTMITAALAGPSAGGELAGADGDIASIPAGDVQTVALLLQHVWYASLVGWAGGLIDPDEVIKRVISAAELLLAGAARRES